MFQLVERACLKFKAFVKTTCNYLWKNSRADERTQSDLMTFRISRYLRIWDTKDCIAVKRKGYSYQIKQWVIKHMTNKSIMGCETLLTSVIFSLSILYDTQVITAQYKR